LKSVLRPPPDYEAIESIVVRSGAGVLISLIPLEQLRESSFYQYILDEGREGGREEGAQRAATSMLSRLIDQRFGELPDSVRQKIEAADSATLHKWSLRLLYAASLDELFTES
jgi:hypothetical protein